MQTTDAPCSTTTSVIRVLETVNMARSTCATISTTTVRKWSVPCLPFVSFRILLTKMHRSHHRQALKAVKRHNPRAEKWSLMRRKNLPTSPHTPVADRLGTAEHKIRKEIAIMKKCRHGHVVRLYEVIDDKLKEKIYMGKSAPLPRVWDARSVNALARLYT